MRPYSKQQQLTYATEPVDPCQVLIDIALLIAESRDFDASSANDPSRKDGGIHCLPWATDDSSATAAGGCYDAQDTGNNHGSNVQSKHVCDHSQIKCRQAKQIVDETTSLWSRNIPVCLHVLVLPEKCANQAECFTTAPVIEQWTLQAVPKRLLPTNHNQLWDCTSLLRAIRSHLHFSHLSSLAIKCRGKSSIVTNCRIRVPGDLDGEALPVPQSSTEASAISSCCSSNQNAPALLLSEKHRFRSCLLAKSLILNVCVESTPRTFRFDHVLCSCISNNAPQSRDQNQSSQSREQDQRCSKAAVEQRRSSRDSDSPGLPCTSSISSNSSRTPPRHVDTNESGVTSCEDLPSSSKYYRTDEEECANQSPTKRRSNNSKKTTSTTISATNALFDLNLKKTDVVYRHGMVQYPSCPPIPGTAAINESSLDTHTHAFDDLPCGSKSSAATKKFSPDVRFFVADDEEDDDVIGQYHVTSDQLSPTTTRRYAADQSSSRDSSIGSSGAFHETGPYFVSSGRRDSGTASGSDWSATSLHAGCKTYPFNRERILRCRKILFDDSSEDAPSLLDLAGVGGGATATADSSSADESGAATIGCSSNSTTTRLCRHVTTAQDDVHGEFEYEYGCEQHESGAAGYSKKDKKSTAAVPERQSSSSRRQFVPSFLAKKFTKQGGHKNNVGGILQFNRRTGLPLSSSPAPITRNRNSFDFDANLSSVSAIRKSLQCYDHESGSSDSDSGVPLCKSAPACTNLLGNFEESALNGRIKPFGSVEGFTLELGASGSFWPSHVTLPVTTLFFSVSDDNAPSPYFGHCSLESVGKKGYHTPKKGTVQATLFNPQGTVVKMFIVRYDLSDMPIYSQTFVRQRTFFMPSGATLEDALRNRAWLRYLIHLRFATSRSGKLYLHTDIRMLFSRKSELDAYNCDYGSTGGREETSQMDTYELRSFTETPKNPKFSPRKCSSTPYAVGEKTGKK